MSTPRGGMHQPYEDGEETRWENVRERILLGIMASPLLAMLARARLREVPHNPIMANYRRITARPALPPPPIEPHVASLFAEVSTVVDAIPPSHWLAA